MPSPAHDTWAPELALNEKYVCVRYLYGRESVTRDVYEHHGEPIYFDTEHEAGWACLGLNRQRVRWCHSCRRVHQIHV